jgi:hypothetical protein
VEPTSFHLNTLWPWLLECRWAEPHWLWLLLLVPVLAFLRGARGTGPAVAFSSLHLLRQISKPGRSAMGALSTALPFVTLILMVAAMARPQHVRTRETIDASGIEIFLAIDVSLSMSIEDMTLGNETVNRLSAAKKVTREFRDVAVTVLASSLLQAARMSRVRSRWTTTGCSTPSVSRSKSALWKTAPPLDQRSEQRPADWKDATPKSKARSSC